MKNEIKVIAVHNGVFHADDVAAVALAKMLINANIKVVRSRNLEELQAADLVVDVGETSFDHHGIRAETCGECWPGIRHCGVTLLAEHFGWMKNPALRRVLCATAAHDNAQERPASLRLAGALDFVRFLNPTWGQGEDEDACFEYAVRLATDILENVIAEGDAELAAASKVEQLRKDALAGATILEIPAGLPGWKAALASTDAKFVIYESKGSWYLQAVPPPEDLRAQKISIVDPLKGATFIFCHASGYLAAWRDRAEALAAAHDLLQR